MKITSVTYDKGQVQHPVSPGHTILELEAAGTAKLRFERRDQRRSWSAKQTDALWPALIAALERARFPEQPPPRGVPPGTIGFTVTVRRGDSEERVSLDPCPEYAPVSMLFNSVIAQMTGDQVLGFTMPIETRYVTDVVEL